MAKPNIIRRLYDWVIHWAETPYAVPALFLLAFAESSFFPIPPDVLLIALAVSIPRKSFYYALICLIASVVGGMLGYGIGLFAYDTIGIKIVEFYHGQPIMAKIQNWYDTYGFWGILIAAITPIPYKVFTIASGVFHFNFVTFMGASILGRGFRFFLVGTFIFFFGAKARTFIEKYFDILAIIFTILLIGGFLVIKFVIK